MWTNTENQLIKGILKHGPDILEHCVTSADLTKYNQRIDSEFLNYPKVKSDINKDNWFMPDSYRNMDIEKWIKEICPKDNLDRVELELELYKKNDLISLLKQMKYIVDTLRKNNVLWGIGRGSSVASYVLYLIGVHRVDSVKYNIPITEFFKGE